MLSQDNMMLSQDMFSGGGYGGASQADPNDIVLSMEGLTFKDTDEDATPSSKA